MARTAARTTRTGDVPLSAFGYLKYRGQVWVSAVPVCGDCGVSLLAYVLMDYHFHLLVEGPLESLSDCMKSVMGTYVS